MVINPKSLANLKPSEKGETNNPNGRPRKGIALVNKELAEKGYDPATKADIEANYMAMLSMEELQLVEMASDKTKPMLVRILAKNMLSNKGFEIVEKMLDRGIGRPTQPSQVNQTTSLFVDPSMEWLLSKVISEIDA